MKYEGSGHLFLGKFQNESVEDDKCLPVVLEYRRNKVLRGLKEKNASIGQLAKATGLGRRMIERA